MLLRHPLVIARALIRQSPLKCSHRAFSETSLVSFTPFTETDKTDLLNRPSRTYHDLLTSTPHDILNATLDGYLPPLKEELRRGTSALPPGHHLVYFPLCVPERELARDGYDLITAPPEPWRHRLWTGGKMSFDQSLHLSANSPMPMRMEEMIKDVTIDTRTGSGTAHEENSISKLTVHVERSIYSTPTSASASTSVLTPAITELRSITYIRSTPPLPPPRTLRSPSSQFDFEHHIPPTTQTLLFRFSALTMNAHHVHHGSGSEGWGRPLVHGPLQALLLLEVVGRHLSGSEGGLGKEGLKVKGFEYRCLQPLFVGEGLTVRGRWKGKKESEKKERLEVWGETVERGLVLRGVVEVGETEAEPGKVG
ncbi:hypothetical protein SAICODRAFT_28974 [Saitoella complicata NRRL Y-17804]|uniref:uncharacterized protein n=1 Tax=Saitoella complicata (strain BCRC 22490 / CBS 7301 / JCM 7358 / NBRC 10748 / NRRL Y-17804) TaxID=698492 RepID=UPI000867A10E|nr:uncharacterized protein SAICODRAFT_28974 [Saitoella complicata NRRL Y-17804]ODQ55317.1 hypothetical protein SAICODRAFT_28974 [Saitoella complicata NRRL Y-17804]